MRELSILRDEAISRHTAEMAAFDFIESNDLSKYVDFCKDLDFYLVNSDYDKNMEMLTEIRRIIPLEMGRYGSNGNLLAVHYSAKDSDYDFIFFFTDAEYALDKISDGKCKITERTVTETTVVCGVES